MSISADSCLESRQIVDEKPIDLDLFRRYAGLSLPRHVSYPMPSSWDDTDSGFVRSMIEEYASNRTERGLSLYFHIPFCEALCKFCACNRVILRKDGEASDAQVERYLLALIKEIRGWARRLGDNRVVRQIHWGGGSPTYLSPRDIERVQRAVCESFDLADDVEAAMEIDPRHTTVEMLETLRRIGFNRVSMGVQDFDLKVQQHVHRVQSFDMVRSVVDACRKLGFDSVNFDLIYGMPFQTPETVRTTVQLALTLEPDRVAYYHYAQIPEKIATQRGMDNTKLPDSVTKLDMLMIGTRLFTEAGYEFVGLDHFAKPDEALTRAAREGTLQRNFQGMTTGGGLDLIGAGVSAISHLLDRGFLQNEKRLDAYIAAIEAEEEPARRGKRLTFDDRVRQDVIQQIYCNTRINPRGIEERFQIEFDTYFERERRVLGELERDGLVVTNPDGVVQVTFPMGRALLRNIAAVFDAYLDPDAWRAGDQHLFSMNA